MGGGAYYTDAHFYELKADVSTVMTSQIFRAEFIQRGDANPSARGPRVLELDGFGSVVPEPGAVALLALGAAGLLAIARRRGGWSAR